MIAAAQAANLGELRRNEAPDQPRAARSRRWPSRWSPGIFQRCPYPMARTAAQRSDGSNLFREKKERLDLASALRELLFWAPGRTGPTGLTGAGGSVQASPIRSYLLANSRRHGSGQPG